MATSINNGDWRTEKCDFICSVVSGLDRESINTELDKCETEEEGDAIFQSLISNMMDPALSGHLEKCNFICSVVIGLDRATVLTELRKCESEEETEAILHSLLLQSEQSNSESISMQFGAQVARQCANNFVDRLEPSARKTSRQRVNDTVVVVEEDSDSDEEISVVFDNTKPVEILEIIRDAESRSGDSDVDGENYETDESSDVDEENYETDESSATLRLLTGDQIDHRLTVRDITSPRAGPSTAEEYHDQSEDEEEPFTDPSTAGAIAPMVLEFSGTTNVAEDDDWQLEAMARILDEGMNEIDIVIARHVNVVCNIFANADPDFLNEKIARCTEIGNDSKKFEEFVEEMLSITNYPTMRDYLKRRKEANARKRKTPCDGPSQEVENQARSMPIVNDIVFPCTICLEEKLFLTETSSCNASVNEHTYCTTCIRRYIESEIGEGRCIFKCMETACQAEFPEGVLRKMLEPSILHSIMERRQLEEVISAGIPDTECCPFCNFIAIIDDPEDKVFRCLNRECMVDSCRLCKEESHIPLRCEEVERDAQVSARVRLENKMSEAMIRECPKCKKRFIKDQGCNHMTCSCGAHICYYCKHLMDSPEHKNNPRCQQTADEHTIHQEDVRRAALEGKQEMDPNIRLVYDPTVGVL